MLILYDYKPVIHGQSAVAEHVAVGYQQFRMAVAQHETQTLCRIGGIQRHIGTSGSQYANRRHGKPLVAWYQNAHNVVFG